MAVAAMISTLLGGLSARAGGPVLLKFGFPENDLLEASERYAGYSDPQRSIARTTVRTLGNRLNGQRVVES